MPELILADYLVTRSPEPPHSGWGVCIAGDRVVALGPHADLLRAYPEARQTWARGKAILPALVNSHMHMYGVLAHGIPVSVAFQDFRGFLADYWWPRVEDRLDHSLVAAAAAFACLEMIETGCTALCDILEGPNSIPGALDVEAEILEQAGLRGILSFESTERISSENGRLGLRENAEFARRQRRRTAPVQGMQCVHTTFSCSPEFLRDASFMARDEGIGLQLHISESAYEPQWCKQHYGVSPAQFYDSIGFWGEHVLASQCVQMEPHELDILRQRGVRVSHMPLSNCEVGGGVAPIPDMLAQGIPVGIGTDGYINNMFELMRGTFLIHKAHRQTAAVMPASQVLELATAGGARAIGMPELGALALGGPADLITVSLDTPTPITPGNFYEQMVLYRNPADVDLVIAAGRCLKRNGEVLALDAERVRAELKAAARRFWEL